MHNFLIRFKYEHDDYQSTGIMMGNNRVFVYIFGFVLATSLLVFSVPVSAQQQGPPDDAGPPDLGPASEDHGPPAHAGPPDDVGKPDFGPASEDHGPPAHAGPPDDVGKPDLGPASEDHGPPAHAGPPDDVGKPEGVPGGGFGGIVATENIVGIEELTTLNVSVPKTATVNNGIRAEGTFLTEIMSANVCGDSLCDAPMSIQEKLQMYLQSRGLTVPER